MDTAHSRATAPWRAVFADPLGKRYHGAGPGGEPLEAFELRAELGATAGFEAALRERIAALAAFQNASFARVRTVQRVGQADGKLVVISERIAGTRLSTILAVSRQRRLTMSPAAALGVIRQVLPAIAMLHEKQKALAHGAISSERIVITPDTRVAVVDHVLGPALEQLQYSQERYWKELRLPVPGAAPPVFDQRTDVMQIGATMIALIVGRPIEHHEWPDAIAALAADASEAVAGGAASLVIDLQVWLRRMLQIDDQPFASAGEAWTDFERVLASAENIAAFDALAAFMTEYAQSAGGAAVAATASAAPAGPATAISPPAPAAAMPTATASVLAPGVAPLEQRPATPAPTDAPVAGFPSVAAATVVLPVGASIEPAPLSGFAATSPLSFAAAPAPPEPAPAPAASKPAGGLSRRWVAIAASLMILATTGVFFGRHSLMPGAAAEVLGTLVVTTNPEGVPVIVDGTARGVSPVTLELTAGAHELLIVARDGEPRVIPLTITAGSTVSQNIELSNKAAERTGELMVRSDPPGAQVAIDGAPIGTTPLTLDGLTPGTHSVTVTSGAGSATQEVAIEPGTTASLFVPLSAAEGVPVSGWVTVSAPVEVHVFEQAQLLGTSRSDRIMVSAGRHDFEIVNEALGYRARRSVTVAPGKVSALTLDWPKGSLALNAQPWAEVWINGESIGETPIGSVSVPIGWHEIVFRHPKFGEQVVRATVTAGTPARVSVDMSKR